MITEKEIKIKGRSYKIAYPNVGQYYEIESLKQRLGRGYYNALLSNPTKTAQDALDMIDIEATLTVLVPDLLKDMKVDSFSELGILDFKELRSVYNKEIYPFLKELQDELSKF